MSEDEKVAQKVAQQDDQQEVQAHKVAAQDDQTDEAAGDDEVEAHRHIRTAHPPKQA